MRIMARAAAATFSRPSNAALFLGRLLSRPPPEPLEQRPSPLIAFVRARSLGEKQVPRVAALMVVSILAPAMQISCGQQPDIRATQTAFMAERSARDARADATSTVMRTATVQANADRAAEATAETARARASGSATEQAEIVFTHATAQANAMATVETRRAEATATMKQLMPPPCRNFRVPPWVDAITHKRAEQITTVEALEVTTEAEIRDYLRWRGSPDAQGCPYVPMPKRMPGDPPLSDTHWRPQGLNTPTPTPVGWHVYPWRRTSTP